MTQRILIIEDDRAVARLLALILEREGYQTLNAPNGLVGLKMARTESLSLILLDLMLPGFDGFEILSRLRNDPQLHKLPIIILSAKDKSSDKELASELGATAYLVKPYQINDLIELIDAALAPLVAPEEKRPGASVILVGPRAAEVASVAVQAGLALVQPGTEVTVVDLHPYSIEHALQLGIAPTTQPFLLQDARQPSKLQTKILHHSSGLKLLNNLVGSNAGGQLRKSDLQALTTALLEREQLVFFDLPLQPPTSLAQLAPLAALTLIVTENQPATLAATRTALNLLEQFQIPEKKIAFVLFSKEEESAPPPELSVLATLPPQFDATHPALQKLVVRLMALLKNGTWQID
ncbi:MAG TPA: response regulator [Thermoflexia bacterium]|nr:response regulator [Thermoflexia bacterium]